MPIASKPGAMESRAALLSHETTSSPGDLPLGRLGRVRERGIVVFSEIPLGNPSGSAPVPKAGAGVREDECAKRNVVHLH